MIFHYLVEFEDGHDFYDWGYMEVQDEDVIRGTRLYHVDHCCDYFKDSDPEEFTPHCPGCGAKNEEIEDRWILFYSKHEYLIKGTGYMNSISSVGRIELIKEY